MTRDADLKRQIRARMARTGERYTTARAHVLAAGGPADPGDTLGGHHDQTAALRDLFLAAGFDAPHTGEPPSEALLLGLGGGLGAAVFAFHYAGMLPSLYVETRCHTQYAYTLDFVARAAEGLGWTLDVHTTGGAAAAARHLDGLLDAGTPAILQVDAAHLPHHALPAHGYGVPWAVVAHERDGDDVVLTDRSSVTVRMPRADLDRARAAYKKGKHAVGVLGARNDVDLAASVRQAVARCVAELQGASARQGFARNFGLAALDKWRDEVAATSKKGWRTTFPAGPALAAGLRQAYAWVETNGTGGGGFRRLYADFLREGAVITGDARFDTVARTYDALADRWTTGFATWLPDGTPLAAIRAGLHDRARGVRQGMPAEGLRAIDAALDALVAGCDPFPTDAEATYAGLADLLTDLAAAERAACADLATLAAPG
ncbi:MAG: DUF4872 domain-containing protein [Alphaproteobacteria bacterium]|nr:DUF4872 domain-containing protein [Alphaproteobacteria bacterium]